MENQNQVQNLLVAQANQADRSTFYKNTYGHVAGGVLVFVIIESLMLRSETLVNFMLSLTQGYLWLALLAGFMGVTWVAQKMAYGSASKSQQYVGYLIYIIAEALLFVPLLYIALAYGGQYVIKQAAVVTGSLFVGLSVIVFLTKTDFSVLKGALTIGFFLAIGLIIAGMLFGFDLGLWFSVGMCALAGGAILYNTHQLKHEFGTQQYVAAALSLFASLMLLFWYILRVFMSRD
ncbi:Bax inhibitor-1 family protein [Weeksella virosa]|uniref:Bax inhibitor-1/YccA family protein n=1 Tax=Weeksella virosa TaxID=1014 RepID=UPI0025542921|nr:Bax inhibitor-1 family protein [Weeksella virosa]MDK7675747.1 Bax inhibitor-1 family protein [Weeksella virosa]